MTDTEQRLQTKAVAEPQRGSPEWRLVEVAGHRLVPHKSCENICWSCGFVTSALGSKDEAMVQLAALDGLKSYRHCPGYWHGRTPKRTPVPKRLRHRLAEWGIA